MAHAQLGMFHARDSSTAPITSVRRPARHRARAATTPITRPAGTNFVVAEAQPAAFADTGIPLLFRTAYEYGVDKKRCQVRLVGGAEVTGIGAGVDGSIGKRNILAARNLLWKTGVLIKADAVGGTRART